MCNPFSVNPELTAIVSSGQVFTPVGDTATIKARLPINIPSRDDACAKL